MNCLLFGAAAVLRAGLKAGGIARAVFQALVIALATALVLFSPNALADYLDDVEVDTDGKTPVIRIRFNIGVQHVRHVPESQGDSLQIFFRQVSADVRPPVAEESRTLPAGDEVPALVVTYPFQNGVATKRLSIKFGKSVRFRVRQGNDSHSLEIVLLPEVVAKPKETVVPARFAIYLDSHASAEQARRATLPPALSRFQVLLSKSDIAGTPLFDRSIGYFDTAQAAQSLLARIAAAYPVARVEDISRIAHVKIEPERALARAPEPAPAPASKSAPPASAPPPFPLPPVSAATAPAVKAPAAPPLAAKPASGDTPAPIPDTLPLPRVAEVAPSAAPEVERQAVGYMNKARNTFNAENWEEAIDALNKLLMLPPNSQSQPAQEMIGMARERNAQFDKAQAEYEAYLKIFPDAEGVARVRQRLALLAQKSQQTGSRRDSDTAAAAAKPASKQLFGSIAQYYYDGQTKSQTAFNTPTTVDQATLSSRDLSSIVTSADVSAQFRSDQSDLRFVVRGSDSRSLIERNPDKSRLDAAYMDYRGLRNPVSLRFGRQTGTGGGVLGRFDGAIAGYRIAKNWKVNAAGGVPVEYNLESKRHFYGLSVDAENILENWSGSVYGIRQVVDGISDREATGGELRYFKDGNSLYAVVDYDTLFKKLNVASVQGSIQTEGQTTYTLLYDERKAPPLTVTNVLFAQNGATVKDLLQTRTEAQLRAQALATTAQVKQVLASVTTPVSTSWQLGADYRLTSVGALSAYEDIPASAGTGNIHSVTLQAIGSNLYSGRDVNVFSASYLSSQFYDGQYYSYSNITGVGEKWSIEPSIRTYFQTDSTQTRSTRFTAILRLSYAMSPKISVEGEYDAERSITESSLQRDNTLYQFFYLGYRYSF